MTKLVHIPFGKGQIETADPKLLPTGLLREAVNVRLRADGRLGMRYGYESAGVDVLSDSDVTPHDLAVFGDQQLLLASGDRTLVRIETSKSWKALDDANAAARSLRILSDVEPIARPPLQNQSRAADVAVNTAGYAAMVWTVPVGAVRHVVALVVRISDGVVLCHQRVDQTEDAEAVRVVALGTKFFLLHVDDATTNLECWTLDTATEGAFTQASASLIASASIHNSYDFDARENGASEFVVAWRSSGTQISWENFSAALATVGSRQTVTANGKLSVAAINNGHVAIANITSTGTVECRTWNEAAQTLVNTTTVDAGTDAVGQPWVEMLSSTVAMVTWGATATGVNATHAEWNYRTINPTSHALGTLGSVAGSRPASGSFYMPSGETGLWLVDTDTIERGYTLARFGASRTPEPEGLVAKPFAATAAVVNERRSKVVSLGSGAFVWAALTLPANADPTATELDTLPTLYRFECERQKRVQRARLGGNLYFAGGLVTLFDGARYYEQDWCTTPTFDEMTEQTGAGTLISESIYTYARVLEWTDARGQRLFSAPSTPVQAALTAGQNTVRFEVSPPFTRKLDAAMGGASINDIVYRSKTDGTVLRELTRFKWSRGQTTPQSFTDATDDCGCDGKPIIYTQGSRGAVSGPLQNDAVNACDYIWAGRDRIIIGRRDGVQWSLRLNETDAVGFTNNSSFFKPIAGVTGVASLDERWIVFTRDAIWEIAGEGPDDDGLQGEFSAPRRLPSEGGCIDSRCLVEVSSGLIYQQHPDRLYLLPRGGGAPVWFSQPVRATLAAFPVITSGVYCRRDNTVAFTCNNLAGSAGKLVIHDMRTGDWYVDELTGAPAVLGAESFSGAHAICGSSFVWVQTEAFADAGASIGMRVRTGAIRPFGVNAWGKVHTVTLLGEFLGDCTVACRFSFDDGASFTPLTAQTLATPDRAVGEAVRLQWSLPRMRTDHVVLEWTTSSVAPSEHIAFNAFTLEVEAADGPPRLAAGDRA